MRFMMIEDDRPAMKAGTRRGAIWRSSRTLLSSSGDLREAGGRKPHVAQSCSGSLARISDSPTSTACTPSSLQLAQLLGRAIPDSETTAVPGGHLREQARGALHIDAEVAQVAVVDTDQIGSDLQRHARARRCRAPQPARRGPAHGPARSSSTASRRDQRSDDQQHRIGAGRACLVQLVGVEDEVLAQDRQRARRPRRRRSSSEPSKCGPSVRIESIAAAPPRS